MLKEGQKALIAAMLILFCLAGLVIGTVVSVERYRGEAIKYGCAQYNPKTADFEWRKNEQSNNKNPR